MATTIRLDRIHINLTKNKIVTYTISMKINHAIDWNEVRIEIQSQMSKIGYNPDLKKMLKNIDNMVTELSKLEVSFRRTQKYSMLDDKVNEINKAINHLEKLILMAKLMS